MQLFLVKAQIAQTYYMSEKDYLFEDIRIVMADTHEEAGNKYCKFWEEKTVEYSIYYTVEAYQVIETII